MLAVRFLGPGQLELAEVPMLPLGPDEVRLRVDRAGICGSDVASWRGDWPSPKVPWIKGHEISGTVVEVGAEVGDLAPGTAVAVRPIRGCGECRYCGHGDYSRCQRAWMHGLNLPGGWAEEMVVNRAHARPLPPGVTVDQGVFAEPIAVITHAFGLVGSLRGAAVAVLGAGILGLLAVQVARALGATAVYATGRQDKKLALALELGADAVGDTRRDDVVAVGLASGGPYDVVLDCIGSSEALDQAVRLGAPGGTILLVAGPHHPRLELDYVAFRDRELAIRASRIYGEDFDEALPLLADGAVRVEPLITHRYPLTQVDAAMREAHRNRAGAIKILLEPGRAEG